MLHDVGDVCLAAIDVCLLQRGVQHPPGRTYEGTAGEVFFIAGLFANDALPEDKAAELQAIQVEMD